MIITWEAFKPRCVPCASTMTVRGPISTAGVGTSVSYTIRHGFPQLLQEGPAIAGYLQGTHVDRVTLHGMPYPYRYLPTTVPRYTGLPPSIVRTVGFPL